MCPSILPCLPCSNAMFCLAGCAFVTFASRQYAIAAIKGMHQAQTMEVSDHCSGAAGIRACLRFGVCGWALGKFDDQVSLSSKRWQLFAGMSCVMLCQHVLTRAPLGLLDFHALLGGGVFEHPPPF